MGRIKQSQITYWCHEIIRSQAKAGGCYIDATMGKGNDTLFLCELAGEKGKVLAFDIQQEALDVTKELLKTHGKEMQAELILDGHEHMDRYAGKESADVICFNFGYLPGGDHNLATTYRTSIEAIGKGLGILKHGGMMSLCIYSGGDTGFEEKEKILEYVKALPGKEYTVTSYTMSEIIASVYGQIEKTGCTDGILFLDEINCVSETLMPAMLQFLQYKTFGSHALPEGWVIVAAGNPPAYNRSVREFDTVTLDRVRYMKVEPDFPIWKHYAVERGLHPAVLSFLELRPERFYVMEPGEKGFVTGRAW